jgi:adenosylcobinamide kinase/adenosylcobinamide-phosphate guanylyltransferase
MRILITGGVKSGKSGRALSIVRADWSFPVSFIATAEALDDEMRLRIARHREERKNPDRPEEFITIEEPLELDRAIAAALPRAVVDCIPMWINNIIQYRRDDDFERILNGFIGGMPEDCIVVTNETGLGNIPFDAVTRRYNLLLAEANKRIAAAADSVELMVSGIPLRVKPQPGVQ